MDIAGSKGLTFIELIVALVIASILLGVGIPALSDVIYSSRRTSSINAFVSTLNYTRNESAKRRVTMIFCLSTENQACMTGSDIMWQRGIVFPDFNGDGKKDNDEPLLYTFEAPEGIDIYASSIYRRKIKFYSDGSSPGSNTTVRFCDPQRLKAPKAVILSNAGRPRVSEYDSSGNDLVCPTI